MLAIQPFPIQLFPIQLFPVLLSRKPRVFIGQQGRLAAVVFGAVAFWLAVANPARAQVPEKILSDPAQIVTTLTFALQSGDVKLLYNWLDTTLLQQTLTATHDAGRFANLAALGPASSVQLNSQKTPLSFSATATHSKALVKWTIAIDNASHRIVQATYTIGPMAAQPSATIAPPLPAPSVAFNHSTITGLNDHALPRGWNGGGGREIAAAPQLHHHAEPRPGTQPSPAPPSPIDKSPADTLSPPPAKPPGSILEDAEAVFPVGPALDPRVVDFLFATTRKSAAPASATAGSELQFTGERNSDLTFGIASIRVPEDHKIGRIELPLQWSLFGLHIIEMSTDEKKHFAIRKVAALSQDDWGKVIAAKSAKKALIFVHGFNTSFEDALYRNAQIVWDLQYPGLSVMFSWASAGDPTKYFYDRDSAYLARAGFVDLLKLLKDKYGIEEVDVIAHSMGNLVVLDALNTYAQTDNPDQIGELIMAAPDVDRDQFVQMLPMVHKVVKGLTLYASSADKALALSRIPAGAPRAGDVPTSGTPIGPVILPDLQTIDVTAVGSEMFGLDHTEFATNRVVVDDIKLLLATGMRPPNSRLAEIHAFPELPATPTYWRYAP